MTAPAGPADLVAVPWGAWMAGRRMPCALGRGGVLPAAAKREGDGASPAGAWRLAGGWWRADRLARPVTCLPLVPLGPGLGWSDDPADPGYNRPVGWPHPFSAERMARPDPLYDLVLATDHNAAARPGMGSAIFLHVWRGPRLPTAGCVALRRADLLWVLARWRLASRLVIVAPGAGWLFAAGV